MSQVPLLRDNEVHVWKVNLLQPPRVIERLRLQLSPTELSRAKGFHKDEDGRRYVSAHGTLRELLALYLEVPPNSLTFSYSVKGKPALSGACSASGLRFNLSHSHELALLAVVRSREIGIDIEHLRPLPVAESIAGRFFGSEERKALLQLPASQRRVAFFRFWTRKEALLKSTGEGLSAPLDTWNVAFQPLESEHTVATSCSTNGSDVWSLTDLNPADNYIGAFAVEGKGCAVTLFELADKCRPASLNQYS